MDTSTILKNLDIASLNEMQIKFAEQYKEKGDIILISPTGSGKTIAFLLPMLQNLKPDQEGVQVLIISPTRELGLQIEQVFKLMKSGYKINCCYGGHSVQIEERNLSVPPTVLVGTPGRLCHHIRKKSVNLAKVHTVILDEFDKSLEMGFEEDMELIVRHCRTINKYILTSATALTKMPDFVRLKSPTTVNFLVDEEKKSTQLSLIKALTNGEKFNGLRSLLGLIQSESSLVFCNHREMVLNLSEQLTAHKIPHGIYHGGMDQIDREIALIKLRNGTTNLLITTDLASRGLDIPQIDAVIHYQLPATEEAMIHRNGRTARMHGQGVVYYLLTNGERIPRFSPELTQEILLEPNYPKPRQSDWATLYIAAGKKDKINKIDIVGLLIQKGNLLKEEIGRIEVLDHSAYTAIKADKIHQALRLLKEEKIKTKKVKMAIAP